MQRLTAAHSSGDLHAMLAIEIEWLGEEANNLTSATDDKLNIYSMVLKEQLAEIKLQTEDLVFQPEYATLRRFLYTFETRLDSKRNIKQLKDESLTFKTMLDSLNRGGAVAREFIHDCADQHAKTIGV